MASASPSSVQFDNVLPQGGGFRKSNCVRVVNVGPSGVFIEITGSGQPNNVSAGTGMFLGAGMTEKFTTAGGTFLAAVTASGSATVYATPGEGGI